MIHIPILRLGQPYRSMDRTPVFHYRTREQIAEVSQANIGLIRRDMLRQGEMHAALQGFKKELVRWSNGVRDIRGDSLAGGEAKMSVLYLGTPDRLADDVGGKTFRGKRVSVTGISGNALVFTLAK